MRERESLIARIRQIHRQRDPTRESVRSDSAGPEQDIIDALESRIAHLEHLVQGLQDSVHREAKRQGKRIADLEARIEPGALGRALSQDARERGLEA